MAKHTKRRRKKGKAGPAETAEPFYRPFAKLPAERTARPKASQGRARAAAENPKTTPPARPQEQAGPKNTSPPGGDAETFALHMAGVKALDAKKTRIPRTASRIDRAEKSQAKSSAADVEARAELRALVTDGVRFETQDDGEHIEGRRVDIDPRDLRRLRRGQFAVDGKLDLHGMTAWEARSAVAQFVRKRRESGDRTIAIVHGKGRHSPRGIGVLRGEIAAWLSQGPSARHVAAFASAPTELGGSGALLVLLAR